MTRYGQGVLLSRKRDRKTKAWVHEVQLTYGTAYMQVRVSVS